MSAMKQHAERLIAESAERREHAKLHGRTAAHEDGYDYADYMADQNEWASLVLGCAGQQAECFLQLAAARDYAASESGMAKGQYVTEHVAGQIDRALEIAGWSE